MKGEISRYSHRPDQRYSGVFWQMGRMLTDADEIELREIIAGAVAGLGDDTVSSGAPAEGGVVEVSAAGAAVALRPGIVYADGLRGEVQGSTGDPLGALDLYANQVDFPNAPATTGDVVYYVDVWERTVTAIEDQGLLDAGLHGADTSFRSQLMAQIKWCPDADPPFFETAANPQKGNALLTAELRAAVTAPDPCDPCAEELELEARVGNYLFRLEVHDVVGPADNPDSVVLKWSAENGAEHHRNGQEPADFQTGKHIYEFYSDEAEKHLGAHGSTGFTPTRRALDDDYPASPPDPADWPFVRRWDGFCALSRSGADLTLSLADGNLIGEDEGVPLTTAPGLGHVEMAAGVLTLELTSLKLTLDTAGKSMLAGDYWLVEVRERAPHDETIDQRVRVVTNEPLGIVHHYTRLVAADADGTIAPLSDAERRALSFPPLTDIPASHVSFDNTCPDLYGPAQNVQEALAALCDADLGRLLREHNRHLHGWGVVCGLKVVCAGSDTPKVAVTPGFMLDQAGYQISLTQGTTVDTLALLGVVKRSGTFCLSASRQEDGALQFHLDDEDEKTTTSILEGTLLWRIYQNCIEPLRKAWEELGGGNQRDARWALIDLLWPVLRRDQTINDRPYVTPEQHAVLQQIYKALQERIVSPTDCALATELPEFPAYPFAAEEAMHGMSFDTLKPEVRVQADGKRAYLFGPADSEIVIVDLDGLKIERTVALAPAGFTVLGVHDVAANADGSLVAAAVRAQDSQQKPVSAILRIGPRSVSVWHQTSELVLTEVELPGGPSGPLYALSPGKGVYRIALNGTSLQQIRDGNYVAHLRVNPAGSQGWAVQAKAGGATAQTTYFVESFSLGSRSDSLLTLSLGDFEPGDLAVTLAGQHAAVAGLTDGGVELRVYAAQSDWSKPNVFLLGQGTPSLATTRVGDQELLAVSLGQQTNVNSLWWFDPFKESLRQSRFLNLQVLPTQIDGGSERLVAINQGSQSLLRVSAANLLQLNSNAAAAAVRTKTETYRRHVIAAFVALVQLWLKAVRDCICHQLLPDCPVLGEPPHKVPLASLELIEGVVDKICNLGCRKFVVTFPTLFYWLSIVPLIPWLHALLKRWCCEEEFDFLSRLVPDEPAQSAPGVRPPAGLGLQQATANAALSLPLLATSPQFATSLSTLIDYADRFAGSRIMDITGRVVDAQDPGRPISRPSTWPANRRTLPGRTSQSAVSRSHRSSTSIKARCLAISTWSMPPLRRSP